MGLTDTERRIKKLITSKKTNPKNLISTILGDVVMVNGGWIWLGSIAQLADQFAIPEYLSRTTALRLVKDGWCTSKRIGKLSYYALSEQRLRSTRDYNAQIYTPPTRPWSGKWYMLFTFSSNLSKDDYAALRNKLKFEGIGQLAPHIFISASNSPDELTGALKDLGANHRIEILETKAITDVKPALERQTVEAAWAISDLEAEYEEFLEVFTPVYRTLQADIDEMDDQAVFALRMMIIMAYRRIALKDPQLPENFLPENWAGLSAYALCAKIYKLVLPGSQRFIQTAIETPTGKIDTTSVEFYDRFGGLPEVETVPATG